MQRNNCAFYPVALYLLLVLLMLVIPLVSDIVGLVMGSYVACTIAQESATRAAERDRFDTALATMQTQASNSLNTDIAAFAGMKPVAGYKGSGADLYIVESNYRNGDTRSYGPNAPVDSAIDPSYCMYEATVRVQYQVGPTISLKGVPFLGNIPGLGKPSVISFESRRAVEYPMGLNKFGDVASNSGGTTTSLLPWDR